MTELWERWRGLRDGCSGPIAGQLVSNERTPQVVLPFAADGADLAFSPMIAEARRVRVAGVGGHVVVTDGSSVLWSDRGVRFGSQPSLDIFTDPARWAGWELRELPSGTMAGRPVINASATINGGAGSLVSLDAQSGVLVCAAPPGAEPVVALESFVVGQDARATEEWAAIEAVASAPIRAGREGVVRITVAANGDVMRCHWEWAVGAVYLALPGPAVRDRVECRAWAAARALRMTTVDEHGVPRDGPELRWRIDGAGGMRGARGRE